MSPPGATIDLVVAKLPRSADLFGAWSYAISNNLGNQISNSWGGAGRCSSSVQSLLASATAKGVTVLASAGDSGAWGIHTSDKKGQIPADCAQVLTVGGTHLVVDSSGNYQSESVLTGTGGGYVKDQEPTYQVSSSIYDPKSVLAKPDVAADADPYTGVWSYAQSLGWFVVGGTSLSCPLWAGFIADVNGARAVSSLSSVGFLNPTLYTSIYGVNGARAVYAANFHDITTGSNCWSARTGWDAATGLGSFNGGELAQTLG
ncbi:MAG: S53 family peptidase [Nitrososphaerales archaeon]